jgi:hypothetical protein
LDPGFKSLSPDEASVVYRSILDEIINYMEQMEVPKLMIQEFVATSSADIHWIDDSDGLEYPPSIVEWEDASCGSFTPQEQKKYLELMSRSASNFGMTSDEQLLYKMLAQKDNGRSICVAALMSKHRDQLPPPPQ